VALFNKTAPDANEALKALEAEWGEPLIYCSTGNFLSAHGLGTVPLDSWGLIALTPTRVMFRHFAQSHPLLGMKDKEQNWSADRRVFTACTPHLIKFWSRMISGTPDHVCLEGEGIQLLIEVTDNPRKMADVWASS